MVAQLTVGGGDVGVDPGEVGLEPGGPHDGVDLDAGAVGERGGGALGGDEAAAEVDAVAGHLLAVGADDQVAAGADPSGERGVGGLVHHTELVQPPEQVAPGEPLRERDRLGAGGDDGGSADVNLGGDLQPGVPGTDHEDPATCRQLVGVAVGAAVQLLHTRVEAAVDGGDVRLVERTRRDDDLTGPERTVGGVRGEEPGVVGAAG